MGAISEEWAKCQSITQSQRDVLICLAEFDFGDEFASFPTEERIAANCRTSRRTVGRAIAQLEELGLITIHPMKRNGGGVRNKYELHVSFDNVIGTEALNARPDRKYLQKLRNSRSSDMVSQRSEEMGEMGTVSPSSSDTMSHQPRDTVSHKGIEDKKRNSNTPLPPTTDQHIRLLKEWNEMAEKHSLSKVLTKKAQISDKRLGHINARLKEFDEETFVRVIRSIPENDWNLGKNGSGWKATFDYVVSPDKFKMLAEKLGSNVSTPASSDFDQGDYLADRTRKELAKQGL